MLQTITANFNSYLLLLHPPAWLHRCFLAVLDGGGRLHNEFNDDGAAR